MSWVLEGVLIIDLIDWMHLIFMEVDSGLPLLKTVIPITSKTALLDIKK
jgi:hypothetical protein